MLFKANAFILSINLPRPFLAYKPPIQHRYLRVTARILDHLVAMAAETSLLKSRIFSDFYSSLYVVLVLIGHLSLFTMTDLIEQPRLPKEMFVEILTLKELNHTGGRRQYFV